MTIWFTSDTHYFHHNIIKYAKRPFADAAACNAAMIDRWNSVVKRGDRIYHLGDFALCSQPQAIEIAKQLRGDKYLIFGNHDRALRDNDEFMSQWIWGKDFAEIPVDGQPIVLFHYAMRVWNRSHYGAWQLHGHSHGSLPEEPHLLQLDVGVDCWDFTPVSFETIRERMKTKTWKPVDGHKARI